MVLGKYPDSKGARMKGTPVHVGFGGSRTVEVWVSSPTGDSSDSIIFTIPCLSHEQARTIALEWATMFGLPTEHLSADEFV